MSHEPVQPDDDGQHTWTIYIFIIYWCWVALSLKMWYVQCQEHILSLAGLTHMAIQWHLLNYNPKGKILPKGKNDIAGTTFWVKAILLCSMIGRWGLIRVAMQLKILSGLISIWKGSHFATGVNAPVLCPSDNSFSAQHRGQSGHPKPAKCRSVKVFCDESDWYIFFIIYI